MEEADVWEPETQSKPVTFAAAFVLVRYSARFSLQGFLRGVSTNCAIQPNLQTLKKWRLNNE